MVMSHAAKNYTMLDHSRNLYSYFDRPVCWLSFVGSSLTRPSPLCIDIWSATLPGGSRLHSSPRVATLPRRAESVFFCGSNHDMGISWHLYYLPFDADDDDDDEDDV